MMWKVIIAFMICPTQTVRLGMATSKGPQRRPVSHGLNTLAAEIVALVPSLHTLTICGPKPILPSGYFAIHKIIIRSVRHTTIC
jgi:hypothetical protein